MLAKIALQLSHTTHEVAEFSGDVGHTSGNFFYVSFSFMKILAK